MSSPGRSRILCLSCAWSRALRFHRKPASKPSSAGSESSMVPLPLLSVLELPPASAPGVYCILTRRTAARARSPFPPASRSHSATCICNQTARCVNDPLNVFRSTRRCCSTQWLARPTPTYYQVDVGVCVCLFEGGVGWGHRCIETLHHFHLSFRSLTSLTKEKRETH